eukprot:6186616-Pleurochrysis_carterae.AAC.1
MLPRAADEIHMGDAPDADVASKRVQEILVNFRLMSRIALIHVSSSVTFSQCFSTDLEAWTQLN